MTKKFVEQVRRSVIGMRPVLPLTQPLGLGHVGKIDDDGVFHHLGTISSMLGLTTLGGVIPEEVSSMRVSVTSGDSVQIRFGADAQTDGAVAQFGKLKGNASISFGATNGFFAAVDGLHIDQLAEPQLLNYAVLAAYKRGQWERDWVFIHRVGVARRLTVVLAKQAKTVVLLKASAKVAANAAAEVDLAAGFKFVASSNSVTQITGGRNVKAFYDAYRVKDGILSAPRVERAMRARVPFGLDINDYPAEARELPSESGQLYTQA